VAFEPLDSDVADFFAKGGELPPSLQAEHDSNVLTTTEAAPTTAAEPPVVPTTTPPADTSDDPVFADDKTQVPIDRIINESNNRLKELQDKIDALTKKAAPAEESAPDPAIDPLGALLFEQRKVQKLIADAETKRENDSLAQKQQSDQSNIMAAVTNQVAAFEKDHPDYSQAYQHVVKLRMHEYSLQGMTRAEAEQEFGKVANQIILRAMQNGKNPAQVVYTMAQKYGFKASAPEKADKTLETIRKGQQASQSLERTTPQETTNLTKSSLGDMSEKELDRVVRDQWDELFGRQKGEI
jgi:hypothetical protein